MRMTLLSIAKTVVALATLIAVTACSNKNDNATMTIRTDSVAIDSVNINVEFQPGQEFQTNEEYPRSSFGMKFNVSYFKDSPWANKMNETILLEVIHANDDEEQDDNTTRRVDPERWKKIFKENDYDLQSTLQLYAQEARQAYEEDLAKQKEEEGEDFISYTDEEETYAEIHTVGDRFINWTGYFYIFLGGAHGMHAPIAITFDRNTGDVVGLDDLLKPGYEPTLRELLKKKVRKEAGAMTDVELQDAGYWSADDVKDYLAAATVFQPEQDGLVFSFPPYAVACYAVGTVSVKLTWDELKDWTK